jgi:hypothetical protein
MTLTVEDITKAQDDVRWDGFGYLGGRIHALDNSDPEAPAQPERVAATDVAVIAWANTQGWDFESLFTWANSRNGRYFADVMFGGGDAALDDDFQKAIAWGLLRVPRPGA